jgi:hypothetical protein
MKAVIFAAYWAFVGYQVHKHEVDVKVLRKFNDGLDSLMKRNAQAIISEAAYHQTILLPNQERDAVAGS